jgi:hypothetical protein
MVAILAVGDFPEIRAALDVSLDITNVPDAVIALDIYLGRATEWVVDHNPAAASYVGAVDAPSRALRRACILATAALIAPSVPWLVQEAFENQHSYKRQVMDLGMLVADLWSQANDQINLSLPLDEAATTGGGKPFFTTASGRRGW